MYANSLTPEQWVGKNTLDVIMHPQYRSLGAVVLMGKTSIGDCPTAYTDGLNVVYGENFISKLLDTEMRFLILHENMHKALRHMVTWLWMFKEDAELANLACDLVINLMLVTSDPNQTFIKMPKGGALDAKYEGLDAGEVYRLLKQDKESGSGSAKYAGFDSHEWGSAVARSDAEVAKISKSIEDALQSTSMLAGSMSALMSRAITESVLPTVRWEDQLRDFVTSICSGRQLSTWRRPNRRYIDSSIYMPSSYSETVGRMCIAVDTSGSISGAPLNLMLAEVSSLATVLQPEVVDLLYWDSRVAAHEQYGVGQYERLIDSTKPKGGGGTTPSCVTAYLADNNIKPECVIMLTDGYVGSDWGGMWTCPVLWCIVNNKRASAPTGKTIHIKTY